MAVNNKAMWTCVVMQNVVIVITLAFVAFFYLNTIQPHLDIEAGTKTVSGVKSKVVRPMTDELNATLPLWMESRIASHQIRNLSIQSSQNISKENLIILVTTNELFIPFAVNWMQSVRRVGVVYNITLVAEDATTYEYFIKQKIENLTVLSQSDFSIINNKGVKHRLAYQNLIRRRTNYILSLLRQRYDILLVDIDAVWLRNPFNIIYRDYSIYHVWVAQGSRGSLSPPCPCFFFIKSCDVTKKMAQMWVSLLQKHSFSDQIALATIFNRLSTLKVNRLSKIHFPTGLEFFNKAWNKKHLSEVFVAHGNHLGRFESKRKAFQENGLWFRENMDA